MALACALAFGLAPAVAIALGEPRVLGLRAAEQPVQDRGRRGPALADIGAALTDQYRGHVPTFPPALGKFAQLTPVSTAAEAVAARRERGAEHLEGGLEQAGAPAVDDREDLTPAARTQEEDSARSEVFQQVLRTGAAAATSTAAAAAVAVANFGEIERGKGAPAITLDRVQLQSHWCAEAVEATVTKAALAAAAAAPEPAALSALLTLPILPTVAWTGPLRGKQCLTDLYAHFSQHRRLHVCVVVLGGVEVRRTVGPSTNTVAILQQAAVVIACAQARVDDLLARDRAGPLLAHCLGWRHVRSHQEFTDGL